MGTQCDKNEKSVTISWRDLIAPKDRKHVSPNIDTMEPINKDAKGVPDGRPDKRSAKDRLFKH